MKTRIEDVVDRLSQKVYQGKTYPGQFLENRHSGAVILEVDINDLEDLVKEYKERVRQKYFSRYRTNYIYMLSCRRDASFISRKSK